MAELNEPKVSEGVHPGSVDLSAHDAGAPSATLNRENVAKVRDVIAHLDKNGDFLTIGDAVSLHTGETGVINKFIPGHTKSVHVIIRRGYGGIYFPFECEKTGDWYCEGQLQELRRPAEDAQAHAVAK